MTSTIALSNNESITLPFEEPSFGYYLFNATEIHFKFEFTNGEGSCSMNLYHRNFQRCGDVRMTLEGEFLGDVFHLSEEWNEFFQVSLEKIVHCFCQKGIGTVDLSCNGASLSRLVTDSILDACAQRAESIALKGVPHAPKHLYRFKETLKSVPMINCFMDEESQIMYGELLENDQSKQFYCLGVSPLTERGLRAILNGLRTSGTHTSINFLNSSLSQVSPESLAELGRFIVESQTLRSVFIKCPELGKDKSDALFRSLVNLQRRISLYFDKSLLETETAAQVMSHLLMENKLWGLDLCGVQDENIAHVLAQSLASSKLERLIVSDCSLSFIGLVSRAMSLNPNRIKNLSFKSCSDGYLEELLELFVNTFDFDQAKIDELDIEVEEDDFLDGQEKVCSLVKTIMERNRCFKKLGLGISPERSDEMDEAVTNLVLFLAPTLRSDKMLKTFSLGDFDLSNQYEDLVMELYRDNTVWTKPHRWANRALTWDSHSLVDFYLDLNKAHRGQIVDPSFPSHLWPQVLANADETSLDTLWYCIQSKPEIAQWAAPIEDDQPDSDKGSASKVIS